jgi:hypothetical protein
MPVKRIVPARLGLITTAHAHVQREVNPVRVGADTANRHRRLFSADQHQFPRHLPRDHGIGLLQPGRGRRAGSGGGSGCGIESKKLIHQTDTVPNDPRSGRDRTLSPQVKPSMETAVLGAHPSAAKTRPSMTGNTGPDLAPYRSDLRHLPCLAPNHQFRPYRRLFALDISDRRADHVT